MDNDCLDNCCSADVFYPLSFDEIRHAAERIEGGIVHTPLCEAKISKCMDYNIYLKCENLQYTGSCAERGIRNALMANSEAAEAGVVVPSSGNLAYAAAYHGGILGIPVTLVLPDRTPPAQTQLFSELGANVTLSGDNIDDTTTYAKKLVQEGKQILIHSDDPLVMAGLGTVGLEIINQLPETDAVIVPAGSGGLLAAIIVACKRLKCSCLVYGAECSKVPKVWKALQAGHPVTVPVLPNLADGLNFSTVGANAFAIIKERLDRMLEVEESYIARAMISVIERERLVADGAGVCAVAAVMQGLVPELRGKRVVCVLSAGNVDPSRLPRCIHRGLGASGRLLRFAVGLPDNRSGLENLAKAISEENAVLKSLITEQMWVYSDVSTTWANVVVEMACEDDTSKFKDRLRSLYPSIRFNVNDTHEVKHKVKEFRRQEPIYVANVSVSKATPSNPKKSTGNDQDVDFDPACDPNNPVKVTFEDVTAASFRIASAVSKTPCVKSNMSKICNMEIYLKCEFLQLTGSFKERGARNTLLLLSPEARKRGVIAASLGNHSQGVSYHSQLLNVPATVVMPVVAPIMKIQRCRGFGANVVIFGNNMKEAKHQAMVIAKEKGLTYVNGYDHPHVIAGQGTVGLEILDQVPDVDAVLIPVGGGSLLAGVATVIKHLKPDVLVYGVETDNCASMAHAMKNNAPTMFEIHSTLADGLAVATVGYNSFFTAKPVVDKMLSVNEDWLARAILRIVEHEKYVVEGGGSVGIAAIMAGLVPEFEHKKVVCILTGGNIDTTVLGRCLERGLAAEHRLVKIKVTVSDRPGGIAELCRLISSIGVSIKDITQERAWIHGDIFSVIVKVICETRGMDHIDELRGLIQTNYKKWFFTLDFDAMRGGAYGKSLVDFKSLQKSTQQIK